MNKLPICTSCWNKRHPDDLANTGGPVHGRVEECQDCGGLTSAMLTDVSPRDAAVGGGKTDAHE